MESCECRAINYHRIVTSVPQLKCEIGTEVAMLTTIVLVVCLFRFCHIGMRRIGNK